MPQVDPIDLAVKMLDVEADKDLSQHERARAMFLRLVAPSFGDACETIARKFGMLEVMSAMGTWVGELAAGAMLPQFDDDAPPEALDAGIEHCVREFERAAKLVLEELKLFKERGS